jgi:hypothetical protein
MRLAGWPKLARNSTRRSPVQTYTFAPASSRAKMKYPG